VLWGPGASAATVLFEREPARFDKPGAWGELTLLGGSNGRFDRSLDAAAGAQQGYLRLLASRNRADDYRDGDGRRIPSRWDKWNSELLLGWTPDADTLLELAAVAGDGEARYAGRSMDGSQFERESLSLRFERAMHGRRLHEVEARVYYHYADHVMDNYSLRTPSGSGMMAMPMASNVDRRTLGARVAASWRLAPGWELEAGADGLDSEHRRRMGMGIGTYDELPWQRDADMSQFGLFGELTRESGTSGRWIAGARIDRASATDQRAALGSGMMLRPNPLAGERRRETLRAGFVRYERDLSDATAYAGLGHSERFPDYWELFSPERGPLGSVSAFAAIEPEQTTQLDLGIHYESGRRSAWMTAYAGEVDDFILFRYRDNAMGMTSSSADNIDARVAGAEVGAGYRVGAWHIDSSVAWAWGENRSDGRALPQMPPLEARFSLGWERGNWSASALWRLVARQGRIASGDGNVAGKDFDDSHGFGVFSVNGAWQASPAIKLSAGVDNLFDRAYSEHLNLAGNAGFGFPATAERFNEPGRTLWGRAEFRF
jgi:iron complex outermembrane receptor protein